MATTVSSTLTGLESLLAADSIPDELWQDDATRKRLLQACRRVSLRLEKPWDTVQRLSYLPLELSVARIGGDMALWKTLVDLDRSSTVDELAKITGSDATLVTRILRYAASVGMVEERGENVFKPSNITRNMIAPGMQAGFFHAIENCARPYIALPEFLARTGYQNPTDPKRTAFQLGHDTDLHIFQWYAAHPKNIATFSEYMEVQRVDEPKWLSAFPLQDYCDISTNNHEDTIAFVDIGGGHGHQCVALLQEFPQLKGRVVLQDLEKVLEGVRIDGVQVMVHDFMTEQPVKGARIYYLRDVLHDWPDHVCETILSRIIDAMSDQSVILIDDLVLPATGAHWYATGLDLAMMSLVAAQERSLPEWHRLLQNVGLGIKQLVKYTDKGDSIIVAAKDEER